MRTNLYKKIIPAILCIVMIAALGTAAFAKNDGMDQDMLPFNMLAGNLAQENPLLSDAANGITALSANATPIVTGVTVSPGIALQVPRGATRQFSATVQGEDDPPQDVTWSLIGNNSADTTVDANGFLQVAANESAPIFTVWATSDYEPTIEAAAYVTATGIITGNNSRATAHNLGRWSTTALNPTTLLRYNTNTLYGSDVIDNEAFYSFTARPGDRFYIRVPYGLNGDGRTLELQNASGSQLRINQGVVDRGTVGAFIYVEYEVPGSGSSNITFFIRITRGNATGTVNFAPAFRELYQNGSETFNFTGTATNPGNGGLSPTGVNSTELLLDLRNNGNIPLEARVRSVETSSRMTPSQGNVRHQIANNGVWYTSIVSSATSGRYDISISHGLDAAAIWKFRYNAMATAASTMTNVTLKINYEYNVAKAYEARRS